MSISIGRDSILERVGKAIGLGHSGHREDARLALLQLWSEVGESGSPLHRVAIAHSMADLQDEAEAQVTWDLRALHASSSVEATHLADAGMDSSLAEMLPSLHLNLGDGYCKMGRIELARHHCRAGRTAMAELRANGYLSQVGAALDRLALRIAAAD